MNDLLVKIADVLDMSVDGVLNSYPLLRNQYASVYVTLKLLDVLELLAIVGCTVVFFSIIFVFLESDMTTPTLFKLLGTITLILLGLWFAYIVLSGHAIRLAPDLIFIKSLL